MFANVTVNTKMLWPPERWQLPPTKFCLRHFYLPPAFMTSKSTPPTKTSSFPSQRCHRHQFQWTTLGLGFANINLRWSYNSFFLMIINYWIFIGIRINSQAFIIHDNYLWRKRRRITLRWHANFGNLQGLYFNYTLIGGNLSYVDGITLII